MKNSIDFTHCCTQRHQQSMFYFIMSFFYFSNAFLIIKAGKKGKLPISVHRVMIKSSPFTVLIQTFHYLLEDGSHRKVYWLLHCLVLNVTASIMHLLLEGHRLPFGLPDAHRG